MIEYIQPISSYLSKIKIYVRDKESVLRKLKNDFIITKKCSEIKDKIDLVIIASYSPTKEDESWLKKHKTYQLELYQNPSKNTIGNLSLFK